MRLAQRMGASGPSSVRITWPILISDAARDSEEATARPLFDRRIPTLRSSRRIVSRNFFGILLRAATSLMNAVSPGASREIDQRLQAVFSFSLAFPATFSSHVIPYPAGNSAESRRDNK